MTTHPPSTTELPIVERLLQIFQHRVGPIFDKMDDEIQSFKCLDNIQLPIDQRVFYPTDFTYSLAHRVDTLGIPEEDMAILLHSFGNYRRTKTIYTIDRPLFHHLLNAKWPSDIPLEAAALPKNGCVLDFPAHEVFGIGNIQTMERVQIICTYDKNYQDRSHLNIVLTAIGLGRDAKGRAELTFLNDITTWINMGSPNLEENIHEHAIYLQDRIQTLKEIIVGLGGTPESLNKEIEVKFLGQAWGRYLKTILSVLLYINGNDDLLELVPPSAERPMNKAKRRRLAKQQTKASKELSCPPSRFSVGKKFASIIQRWEEREPAESMRIGRSACPHLRAAHAHLYRIGKGRTGQRVRFLPPIPVKGWEAPEEEPTSRLVK